jgi:MFS family permease
VATQPAVRTHRSPLPTTVVRLVTVLAVVSLVNLPDALLLLRVSQVGFSAAGVAAVYAVYHVVYALGSYPAGALSERWPRHRVFALGLACFAIGVAGLGLAHGAGWVVLLMAVYGGFNACTDGVGKAWVSALAPDALRGRAQGVFQSTTGAAVLVAGVWGGLAWGAGRGHGTVPLVVAGCVAGVAAVVLVTVGRRLSVPEAARS